MASTTHDADDPVLRRRNSFWKDVGRAKPGWVILAAVAALAGPQMTDEILPWAGNGSGSTYVDSSYARTASHDWEARQATNRHTIDRLDTGTSRAFAMARLAAPDFVETYGDVVFYRTSRVNDDGLTTKRTETTPIVFHDDVLVNHGRYQTGSTFCSTGHTGTATTAAPASSGKPLHWCSSTASLRQSASERL